MEGGVNNDMNTGICLYTCLNGCTDPKKNLLNELGRKARIFEEESTIKGLMVMIFIRPYYISKIIVGGL